MRAYKQCAWRASSSVAKLLTDGEIKIRISSSVIPGSVTVGGGSGQRAP